MGSGGVGASARTGNHFHLSCDSSEWSMMLRPLTTSVVLFMESTFFYFRVTISGKLCHKLPPPAFGGGGSCSRGCLLSTALRAILLSFGRGDGGRFKRPASCGSGSVHQTGAVSPESSRYLSRSDEMFAHAQGHRHECGRMRRDGQIFATSSCLTGQYAKVCRQDRGRVASGSPKI